MKKQFILLSSLCSLGVMAQHHSCGFEHHLENQREFIKIQENISTENQIFNRYQNFSVGNQIFSTQNFTPYNGPIYEIPVVVHLIESNEVGALTDNRTLKVTDEQVKQWIENTNKIYATTYGNGFFPEGEGARGGNIIPFKLVLAKRDKNLNPTTGIIRYNGDHIPKYGLFGVRNGITDENYGPKADVIRQEFPHWPEDLYYNIYVVVGIDGNKSDTGVAGFAGTPDFGNGGYDAFMAAKRVTKPHDVFLAHEFGHSLGLPHPFQGGGSSDCPANNDCTRDNDGICDTEPVKAFPCFENAAGECERVLNDDDINPCTQEKFQGTQYNIMAYAYEPAKFTLGQREKALKEFFKNARGKSLVKSRGGETITETSEIKLTNACSPRDSRWFTSNKTRKITFGSIDIDVKNSTFYTDYTTTSGLRKGSYTDLIEKQTQTLVIESEIRNKFHAWIDYNNNGNFETNERITPTSGLTIPAAGKVSLQIIPAENAIKNTYLRLRILTDEFASNACAIDFMDGNINDFAVRIVEEKKPEPITDPIPTQNSNYEGRVGINTPEPQATLDIREVSLDQLPAGQSQGVLFPNFTTEQRDKFQNVTEGTMIFNTTLKCLEIYKGADLKWQCIQ